MAEAIPSSSNDVEIVNLNNNVESTETPSSGINDRPQYVVFVPPKFFQKVCYNEKSTVYKCLLGCPSRRNTTVSHSLLTNARRHISTFHRVRLDEFNKDLAAVKKSANSNDKSVHQSLDKHLVNLKDATSRKHVVTQADLDRKIMNFIIKDTLPLREVEREGFLDFMGSVVGKLVVKKRTLFTERLQMEYSNTKTSLMLFMFQLRPMYGNPYKNFHWDDGALAWILHVLWRIESLKLGFFFYFSDRMNDR
jgi:hypothetical protein